MPEIEPVHFLASVSLPSERTGLNVQPKKIATGLGKRESRSGHLVDVTQRYTPRDMRIFQPYLGAKRTFPVKVVLKARENL